MGSTRSVRRFGPFLGLLAFAAMIGIGVGGCDRGEKAAGPYDDTMTAVSGEPIDAGPGAGPFATLTVEQIDARLKLTGTQREAIESALARARATRGARVARWGRGRQERRAAAGRPHFGPAAGEPPALVFLEDASKTLTPDQFVELARLLREERDRWAAERAVTRGPASDPGRGAARRMGGRHGVGAGADLGPEFDALAGRAAGYLDLSEAQRGQIRGILETRGGEIREIRSQIASGATTPEVARERIRAIRAGTRDKVKSVLTAEQWEKADAFRTRRVGNQVDARLSRIPDQIERRAAFLDRVLDLTPDQARRVQELLKGTIPEREEILSGVKAGTVLPEDAAARVLEVEKGVAARIGSLLTPEQTVRWDALRDLLPRGGPGRDF
jgi:hypothetical protein